MACAYLIILSVDYVNPDAVCYVQAACHWADGRWDVAVNSWWSPLLSWLLVPAVRLGGAPLVTVKALNVLFGLAFAWGVVRLVRRLDVRAPLLAVFAAALLLVLTMLPAPVTPDVLFMTLLTWYFVFSLRLLADGSRGAAVAVGLLGGVTYLAKAYALPFILVHLGLTLLLRWQLVRRGLVAPSADLPQGRGVRQALGLGNFALAAIVAVALAMPWIAAISLHDGTFTISGAGRGGRASAPVFGEGTKPAVPFLRRPSDGHLFVGEDPLREFPEYYLPRWSPLDGLRGLKLQAVTVFRNAATSLALMRSFDGAAVLMAGLLVTGLLVFPLRPRLAGVEGWVSLWLVASVCMFAGGYVMMVVMDRLLWPVCGLLVAMTFRSLGGLADELTCRSGQQTRLPSEQGEPGSISAGGEATAGRSALAGSARPAAAVLILASIGLAALSTIDAWRGPAGNAADATWLRQAARDLAPAGPFASNSHGGGLAVCFWADRPFVGVFTATTPEALAAQLRPLGSPEVLVLDDEPLADRLEASPLFKPLGRTPPSEAHHNGRLFAIVPM
jgi:hypothetical protein